MLEDDVYHSTVFPDTLERDKPLLAAAGSEKTSECMDDAMTNRVEGANGNLLSVAIPP